MEERESLSFDDAVRSGMVRNADGSEAEILEDASAQRREHSLDSQFEELQTRQTERRQEAEAEREAKAAEEAEQAKSHVREAREWTGEDKQVVASLQQRGQQLQAARQQLQQAEAIVAANPGAATPSDHEKLAAMREVVAAEETDMRRAALTVQNATQQKSAEAARRAFQQEFPEAADPEFRKKLIDWAVKEKGIPESVARNETRPHVVGPAIREFQAFEKQQASEAKAKRIEAEARRLYSGDPVLGGDKEPTPRNADQAMARLARTNKLDDALAYLQIKQLERAK